MAAKRSPGRRFHALYDRIWRGDVLWEAWSRVKRTKGAAGVDRQTLAAVEESGVERLLAELQRDVREGRDLQALWATALVNLNRTSRLLAADAA